MFHGLQLLFENTRYGGYFFNRCESCKKIGTSEDGWGIVYIDSLDGRYWELTYPDSGS